MVSVIAVIFLIQNSSDADSGYSNDYSFYESEEDIVIEHSFITDTNYTNPNMDISFDLPSSYWRFLSNQEIYDIFSEDVTLYEIYFDSLGYACAENMYEIVCFDAFAANMVDAVVIFVYYAETTSLTRGMSADEYLIDSFNLIDNEDIYSYSIAGREYRVYEDISYDDGSITAQSCAVRRTGDNFFVINVINYPEVDSNETTYYMDLFY